MLCHLIHLALLAVPAYAAEWAVLVAGSQGYYNYRHQADVAHAYQVVKAHGVPESNIIVLMYDDVAHSEDNPYPGKLFNKPTAPGIPGVNVYEGLTIDYRGKAVTPKTFEKVLTGSTEGLDLIGSGKVLKSTAEDDVFVNFVDHGGTGLIAFPSGVMHAKQLHAALLKMHQAKMYKRLVFYLEACESGSMFSGSLPKDISIYATTASNPKESSWGTYCAGGTGHESSVDGKDLKTCLGDLYSVNWMENVDQNPSMVETLLDQYMIVKNETAPPKKPTPGRPGGSHVMQYGDLSLDPLPIGDFMGPKKTGASIVDGAAGKHGKVVSARDIELHTLYHQYMTADTASERASRAERLQREVAQRQGAEAAFRRLVELAYPADQEKQTRALHGTDAQPLQPLCELAIHNAMAQCSKFQARSGYALKFQRVAVNLCADESLGWQRDVQKASDMASSACGEEAHGSSAVVV